MSKMMRKIALITAISLMVFSLSACKSKGDTEVATPDTVVEGSGTVSEEVETDGPVKVENEEPEGGANTTLPNGGSTVNNNNDEENNTNNEENSNNNEENNTNNEENSNNNEENNTNTDDDDEYEETDLDKAYAGYLKVASYNVQTFQGGKEMEDIAAEIKSINPDIIGLQEIDKGATRSGGADQVAELAALCGYKYYYFGKSIDITGGEYGHAMMSKYPIKSSETVKFATQYAEERSYDRVVLDVNGTEIVFYNTHLCLGTGSEQAAQMAEITKRAVKDKYAIITGDMNATPQTLSSAIDTSKLYPLNGSDVFTFVANTMPEINPTTPIDNIIVSTNFDYYVDDSTQVGIIVNITEWSDHCMIYTYLNPTKK